MYKLFRRILVPGVCEIHAAGACDPGIARDHNEDAIALTDDSERGDYLGIVCDGMGGHNAGEVASALAVETLRDHLTQYFSVRPTPLVIAQAFELANARIDEQAALTPEAHGMGCTAVLLAGHRDRLWIGHAGDSRAYRFRGPETTRLTADHTMVQEMLQAGLLTAEQAAVHPYRGRISRCIGHGKNRHEPDVAEHAFERGDTILLCSDGLSDVVLDEELASLCAHKDLRTACRRLIETANRSGGPDNVSAVLFRRVG